TSRARRRSSSASRARSTWSSGTTTRCCARTSVSSSTGSGPRTWPMSPSDRSASCSRTTRCASGTRATAARGSCMVTRTGRSRRSRTCSRRTSAWTAGTSGRCPSRRSPRRWRKRSTSLSITTGARRTDCKRLFCRRSPTFGRGRDSDSVGCWFESSRRHAGALSLSGATFLYPKLVSACGSWRAGARFKIWKLRVRLSRRHQLGLLGEAALNPAEESRAFFLAALAVRRDDHEVLRFGNAIKAHVAADSVDREGQARDASALRGLAVDAAPDVVDDPVVGIRDHQTLRYEITCRPPHDLRTLCRHNRDVR